MTEKTKTAIVPTREENYSDWYQQVIKSAELAEHSPVRGCMVIKPWGYGIWENIQRTLNQMFKEVECPNAYFPLFIPLSFLEKEAGHVEGFAKECAVVTHHRLEKNKEGKLVPASPLEEPLIVRPTSETIIGEMFSNWIESYRDLPLRINQWANVVRWEMRTRLFLRTTEFLWQEGHTAHATEKEAREESLKMLDVYEKFVTEFLALPVIKGEKTEGERFPGASSTYTIEMMMQDKKALQAGTSHFLGQNFAKAANISFCDENGKQEFAWTTSWGMTTRMIGALIMVHGDDDGIVLPPKIAASQIVILPVVHKEETKAELISYCKELAKKLKKISYHGFPLDVIVDTRDMRGGDKQWSWIKKGIPVRMEIGAREMQEGKVTLKRRDLPHRTAKAFSENELLENIVKELDEMQQNLYEKALAARNQNIHKIDTMEEFYRFFTPKNKENPEIHGGFALCHFSGDPSVEEKIKEDLSVTVRCIPLDAKEEEGKCVISGKKSMRRVIFAKSY